MSPALEVASLEGQEEAPAEDIENDSLTVGDPIPDLEPGKLNPQNIADKVTSLGSRPK